MPKEILIAQLLLIYGGLLTEKQREIAEMYYSLDLSLGEIAEIKSISRQSVNDTLQTVRNELNHYEQELKLCHIKTELYALSEKLDEKVSKTILEIID